MDEIFYIPYKEEFEEKIVEKHKDTEWRRTLFTNAPAISRHNFMNKYIDQVNETDAENINTLG